MKKIIVSCIILATLISCTSKKNIRANENFTSDQWTSLFEDLLEDLTKHYDDSKPVYDELTHINEIQASGDIVISTTWIDDPRMQIVYSTFNEIFKNDNPQHFDVLDLSKTLKDVKST